MKTAAVIIAALAVLSACEMGASRVEESNPMVTYNYNPGEIEDARLQAERYCQENYARSAELVSRMEGAATYECSD